jgi:hypothetical protein
MRSNLGIDLDTLNSISDLYRALEENAFQLSRNSELPDLPVAYRDKTTDADEKRFAQLEIDAFIFYILGDKAFAYSYAPTQNVGELQEYPKVSDLDHPAYEYFKKRAFESVNPVLVARYNHLLWRSPKGIKNRQYALKAIKAYFEQITAFFQLYETDKLESNLGKIADLLKVLIALCIETKDSITELKILTQSVLLKRADIPFWLKNSLLEKMLDANQIFKPADFSGMLEIFEEGIDDSKWIGDKFLWANNYCDTAISVAKRSGDDFKRWHEQKGDCFVYTAEQETKAERMFLKASAYTSAIAAYRQAGNFSKRKRIEQSLFELKPSLQLGTVRIEASADLLKKMEEMSDHIKVTCAALLKQPPEVIYATLIDAWFYPSKKATEKAAAKLRTEFDMFKMILFDRNKNIFEGGKDTAKNKKFYEAYSRYIYTVTLQYYYYIFVPGIRSGHLTFKNFIGYLKDNSWLGKPYLKTDLGGKEIAFNWLTLISPALVEYFVQVQSWQFASQYTPNYVLCIDSLTLKMEGLLRNFAERLNVSTTVSAKGGGTQEALIGNIFENEIIQAYFSEDDIQFFKYLFANEGGLNMRNKVAHSLYNITDYDLDKMHLLLMALIRIAQYDLTEPEAG